MRLCRILLPVLVLSLLPNTGFSESTVEDYYLPHTVFGLAYKEDESDFKSGAYKSYYKVSDHLQIERNPEGTKISIRTYGNNGHTCSLWGKVSEEYGYFRLEERVERTEEVCDMRIVPEDEGYVLVDIGGICKQYFCGMRAGFGRIKFTRSREYDCKRGFYFMVRDEYGLYRFNKFDQMWMIPGMVYDGFENPCSRLEEPSFQKAKDDQAKYYSLFVEKRTGINSTFEDEPIFGLQDCLEIERLSIEVKTHFTCQ